MKFNKLFLLAPIAVLSLTSCGKQVRYTEKEYVLNYNSAKNPVPYSEGEAFNVLQLSDIHFTYLADNQYHFKFIQKTINAAKKATGDKLHLIAISGDTFTFATKDTIKECCDFFESQGTPWTITFGNHDEQGYFSVDWMTGYLTELSKKSESNLLFVDHPDDDVFGSANFVINLHNNDHLNDNRQIIMIDSNRYNYGEDMGYDYIHTDQIDWYERMYYYFKEIEHIDNPTSIAFFHIPLVEYTDAYNKARDANQFDTSKVYNGNGDLVEGKEAFKRDSRGEDESSPKVNSGFLDRIARDNFYTKGIFVGHDHINNYSVNYDYDDVPGADIKFNYGIKATNTVYYDDAYLGGQIIHFGYSSDPSVDDITTDLILHKYSEMEVK